MQKRMFFFIASNALALSGVLYLSKIFQTVVFSKKIFQTVFLSIVFLGYGDNMLEFFFQVNLVCFENIKIYFFGSTYLIKRKENIKIGCSANFEVINILLKVSLGSSTTSQLVFVICSPCKIFFRF